MASLVTEPGPSWGRSQIQSLGEALGGYVAGVGLYPIAISQCFHIQGGKFPPLTHLGLSLVCS